MTNQTKSALSYVFGFISGIVFLFIEKDNEFIRKSAAQSIVFSIVFLLLYVLLKMVPIVSGILTALISLLFFVLWVMLIIQATRNTYVKVPIISYFSEKYILKQFTKN